jgi:hypothetical protein
MSIQALVEGLTAREPMVRGIIFCDEEGERVMAAVSAPDAGQAMQQEALDIVGASLAPTARCLQAGYRAKRFFLQCEGSQIWVGCMRSGYYLVVLLDEGLLPRELQTTLQTLVDALETEVV